MCSLNNAINLYREESEKYDKQRYIIVKTINDVDIPLKNKEGNIEYFTNIEEANIDRIYHQAEYIEILKVIKI